MNASPTPYEDTPGSVIERHQGSVERVRHLHSGLLTDQHPSEVIPRAESIDVEVDVGVEAAVGDRTQIKRRSAEAAELTPAGIPRRKGIDRDDRFIERHRRSARQWRAVDPGPSPGDGVPPHTGSVIVHHRHPGPITVDHTDARREPRQRSRCVRRAVEWIEHGDKFSVARPPRLFTQHSEPSILQHRQRRLNQRRDRWRTARLDRRRAPSRRARRTRKQRRPPPRAPRSATRRQSPRH